MAVTPAELAIFAKSIINYNEKNPPTDQVNIKRPLLEALNAKKKTFSASLQYVEENLHTSNGVGLQWLYGADLLTYNAIDTLDKAQFAWRTSFAGITMHYDELAANGVVIADNSKITSTSDDRAIIVPIMTEKLASLDAGIDESFHRQLWLDGTQSVNAPAGIDALISVTPALGVVGGIDRAAKLFWRNNAQTGIVPSTATFSLLNAMDAHWRQCSRFGKAPTHIFASAAFIDAYKTEMGVRQPSFLTNASPSTKRDVGYTGVFYNNIELIWVPDFDTNFGLAAPLVPWSKRCYFLNLDSLKLRPMDKHDWVSTTPARPSNQFIFNTGKVWRGALTANQVNNQSVLSIA